MKLRLLPRFHTTASMRIQTFTNCTGKSKRSSRWLIWLIFFTGLKKMRKIKLIYSMRSWFRICKENLVRNWSGNSKTGKILLALLRLKHKDKRVYIVIWSIAKLKSICMNWERARRAKSDPLAIKSPFPQQKMQNWFQMINLWGNHSRSNYLWTLYSHTLTIQAFTIFLAKWGSIFMRLGKFNTNWFLLKRILLSLVFLSSLRDSIIPDRLKLFLWQFSQRVYPLSNLQLGKVALFLA